MKSMVRLACQILLDLGEQYRVDTSFDELTLIKRCHEEGESFLTITLPSFEKQLMTAIEAGSISSVAFLGFKKTSGLPAFLQGFLRMLFHDNGMIDELYPPHLLRGFRQFLLTFSKVERPCTEERTVATLRAYSSVDSSLPVLDDDILDEFAETANWLFRDYFQSVENLLYQDGISPRHSSGSLATRETYNQKFSSTRWSERIEKVFPSWDHFYLNPHHMLEVDLQIDREGSEPPAKVITVPKTAKAPRVIAMEPVYNQFVQQGILRALTQTLRDPKHRTLWSLCCWDTQEFNRKLALLGSIDGSLATIDLSEASDRVSLSLVQTLFRSHPFLLEAVLCCRSTTAETPLGKVELKKFASMGSSLCFPIETFVFLTAVFMGVKRDSSTWHAARHLLNSGLVRVYGDDIIVPNTQTRNVIQVLEAIGLKVNTGKSFWNGTFRESCGLDGAKGVDVSVHRLRVDLDNIATQNSVLEGAINFRNKLYNEFIWERAVQYLDGLIDSIRTVPRTPEITLSGLSLISEDSSKYRVRWNTNLHKLEYQVLMTKYKKPKDELDGWGALRKFFANGDNEFPLENNHLQRDGRSQCVGIYTGWSGITP